MQRISISRRAFLKLAALGMGGLAFRSLPSGLYLPEFPANDRLGRILAGKVELKARPNIDSETVGVLYDDAVVPWLSETVGPRPGWHSQRWVETPEGYIYSPNLQPVRNQPNTPISQLPQTGATLGMWAEVTVPYADLILANPPGRAPWVKIANFPRVYYSQILWIDEIKQDPEGQIWYRFNERYGSYGDIFWVAGEALRPLTDDDISPISPGVEDKSVVVDLTHQSMACYEGTTEVYYCRIASGDKFDPDGNPTDTWSTPVGPHHLWRKMISTHMSGGTTGGGWDHPGIGWTTLFVGTGVAIHSTYWHNGYGSPQSNGCVNARPDDAKWVFRWTNPVIPLEPGDMTVSGTVGTKIVVVES